MRVKKIDYGFREEEHLLPLLLNIALRRTSYTDLAWLAREEKLLKKSLGFGKLPKERAVATHLEKYGKEQPQVRRLLHDSMDGFNIHKFLPILAGEDSISDVKKGRANCTALSPKQNGSLYSSKYEKC